MKRAISILLVCVILFSGCSAPQSGATASQAETVFSEPSATAPSSSETALQDDTIEFSSLSDPALTEYVEEQVYQELITRLDSPDYLIERVSAVYVSNEYLEENAYNSQANIYFGYTLDELDEYFQDTRYVFTLGEYGETAVRPFEAYDDIYEQVIHNLAIGTGVILICVTVSAVAAAGAPAISLIFAASAKTGTLVAASTGAFSALAAGVVTGVQTQDLNAAMKSAALAGSEGVKWGAISGAFEGGLTATMALKGATLNGLTMSEAAAIQRDSHLPLEFIKSFHSKAEYQVYKNAGLKLEKVNGAWALTQDIDWNYVDDVSKLTNAQRVENGLAPLDPAGTPYELHHIGQKSDSPLAILTNRQHHGNNSILHTNTGQTVSEVTHGSAWQRQVDLFWDTFYDMCEAVSS